MQQIAVFYPTNIAAWREWLEKNHHSSQAVWLVYYSKRSSKPSITWSEAVDVALCYGWIDSKKISVGKDQSHQYFTKRKEKSTWSKVNKEKVSRLIDAGLMTAAGLHAIEIARKNGSWTLLDNVEKLVIPKDLAAAFKSKPGSKDFFLSLSKSVKKAMLQSLALAKRTETRQNRIHEIAEHAAVKQIPKRFETN